MLLVLKNGVVIGQQKFKIKLYEVKQAVHVLEFELEQDAQPIEHSLKN